MTNTPSTAAYQKYRADTLRGISREQFLKTARELMRSNQKNGFKYKKVVKQALRGNQ